MKRLLALLLCLSTLLALAACGNSNNSANTSPVPSDSAPQQSDSSGGDYDVSTLEGWGAKIKSESDGKTITVAMASHPSTEAFQDMVDDFTALTGIDVVWDVVEETNLKSKQLLDVQGSGTYDVLMVDAFWMAEYASKGLLVPLADNLADETLTPAWFDYEDIMPAYRDGISSANGVIYAIPSSGETRFIAYRTDLFEKYDKQPPETMAEFLELAQFFNDCEDVEYGVSMRAQRGIHFASGWMSLMYNFGGGFLDQTTLDSDNVVVTCTTPETVESLQYFVDLMKCAPPDVSTYTHEEALGAFISGKTAMWLDATALADQITDPESSVVADNVAFVATPTGPAGDGAALAGWSLGISTASKNSAEAWAFIVYMASKENSLTYVGNGGGATRASVFENAELAEAHPSYPAQLVALEAANGLVEKGLSWIPQHEQSNAILEIAGNNGCAALVGDMTVEEACQTMQTQIEDLLASS